MGVITNVYLNALRNQHLTDETKALIGDDNTPAVATDESLGNQFGSKSPIQSFVGDIGEVSKIYLISSDEFVGEVIREVGFTTKELLQSREVIADITKSQNEVIQVRHKTTYRQGV